MKKIAVLSLFALLVGAAAGTLAFGAEAGKAAGTPAPPAAAAPVAPEAAPPAPPPKPKASIEDRVAKVGDKAIDFSLLDMSGENLVTFADLNKGTKKLMALVFLNSTCASCVNEAELLASMKKKYQDDLNLVAIITDMNTKIFQNTASENMKNSFTVVHDGKFSVPPAYGFNFTPGLVVIKGSKVVGLKGGFIPGKDDKEVVDLIKSNM